MKISELSLFILTAVTASSAFAADFGVSCQLNEVALNGQASITTATGVIKDVQSGYQSGKKVELVLKPGVVGVGVSIDNNLGTDDSSLKRVSVGLYQAGNRIVGASVLETSDTVGSPLIRIADIDGKVATLQDRLIVQKESEDSCTPTQGGYGPCEPIYPGQPIYRHDPPPPEVVSNLEVTCAISKL